MLLVKIPKYIGFSVYRRSHVIWSPVIVGVFHTTGATGTSEKDRDTAVDYRRQ